MSATTAGGAGLGGPSGATTATFRLDAGAAAATPGRPQGQPQGQRRRGAMPRGLRLRDHGVTPLFLVVAVVLTLIGQLNMLAFILMLLHLADGVVETRNLDTLIAFTFAYALMGLVAVLSLYYRWMILAAVAERFGLRMQAMTLQAAVRTAVQRDAVEGASLLQDIATVQSFLRSTQPTAALDCVVGFAALGLMFYLDTTLGYIALGGITATILMGMLLYRATRDLAKEAKKRNAQTGAELGGQLVHPDLMRGLGMLKTTMLRWQPRYAGALSAVDRVKARSGAISGIDDLVMETYAMVVKVFVCILIFQHVGTLGMLIAAILLSTMVVSPFGRVAKSWFAWSVTAQSWARIREALEEVAEPAVRPPDPAAPPGLMVEDLVFQPEGRRHPIIGGLTLRLAPGTVATIEGPNGAGKSTLVRLVLGLLQPTAGRVLLDGQDSWHADRAEFGPRIGYLPQEVQLLEGTVIQNIGRGEIDVPPEAAVLAARTAGAHEMIGRLPAGYQTPSGATSGLSAGQRRLIGLARALYGEPRLLVLDEPEVGLDGYARVAMRAAVQDVRARGGMVLIVTHESDTWRDIADLHVLLGPRGTWQVQPAGGDRGGDGPEGVRLAALH